MKKINFLFTLLLLTIAFSCQEDQKQKLTNFEKILRKYTLGHPMYDPINGGLAGKMEDSFKNNTYDTLLRRGLIKENNFILDKREWIGINDTLKKYSQIDTIRLYLIQFNQAKFPQKYNELNNYNGKLYILWGYYDREKLIGDKYYGVFSIGKTIEVSKADFLIMHNDYKQNIKPLINQFCSTKDNTECIKIGVKDFKKQASFIGLYDRYLQPKKIKHLRFKLAEVQNPTIVISAKNKKYYIKKYMNEFGQLTTLTDSENTDDKKVELLSNYDMNTLCPPNNCP